MSKLTKNDVVHIAKLANLALKPSQVAHFTGQFNETLKIVDKLDDLDVARVKETSQVTGLINVFREDRIEQERILSQKEALMNAREVYNGYFVVNAVINEK